MSTPLLSYRPASLNLEFVAGDDVPVPLTFSLEDDAGVVTSLNLTDCQVNAYIEDGSSATASVAIQTQIVDALAGAVKCVIPSASSAALNTTGKSLKRNWFVQVVDSLGARRTYVSGTVTILPRV